VNKSSSVNKSPEKSDRVKNQGDYPANGEPHHLPLSWWAAARWLGIDDDTAARAYAKLVADKRAQP
jgi:hypothetical protein